MKISVIICAHTEERWSTLVATVDSIRKQTLQPDELIMSIDHNTPLADRIRRELPGVMVVENHGEKGISATRNTSLIHATGDLLAFIDDDAIAAEDWLEKHVAYYKDPKIVGVGGAISPTWGEGASAEAARWLPKEYYFVLGCDFTGRPTTPQPIRNTIAANMSIRADAIRAVRGFRSFQMTGLKVPLYLYCDETDMCIRVRQAFPDKVFMYAPDAKVLHIVPPQRLTWSYFSRRCYTEGVSKVAVTSSVGGEGLTSEWNHVLKILPLGALRGIRDGITGDFTGFKRSFAIVAGLFITLQGFLYGKLNSRHIAPIDPTWHLAQPNAGD